MRQATAADPAAAGSMKRVWWRQRPRLLTGRLGKMALYGSSRSIVEGLLGVRGMLLAGMLGPQLFGVWALFRLVLNYGAFAGIGLQRGLELEVAKVRAPEHQPVRTAWARTAVGCTFAIFGLVSVLTGASALMVDEAWLEQLLWAIAAGLLLERMWFYGLNYLRASGSLREYAVLELAQAALQVLLTVGLAWLYGLPGAFAGFALASLIMMVLVSRQVPYRPAFDLKRLRVMLAIGMPLSLSMLLSTLAATVDRVIVGALLGVAALGQYAFAVSVAHLGVTAAMIVRTVVFPDLYSRLDQDGAAELNQSHLELTIRPFVLLLAPLAGVVAVALGPIVAFILPQFAAAVQTASVFVFAGIAQGVVGLATLGVVAAHQQNLLPVITLASLALNAALAFGALSLDLGLLGMAAGAVVGRLAYALGAIVIVARVAGIAPGRSVVSVLWPIAWCALVSGTVNSWLAPHDFRTVMEAISLYLLGVAPVLGALARSLHGFSRRGRAKRVAGTV